MTDTTRRSLLTVAALGASAVAAPVRAAVEPGDGDGDGEMLAVASRRAASARRIPPGVTALNCAGYARAGDRGRATYLRVAAEPVHQGKLRSADGAWWELAELELNPFQFGAKGDGRVDDSAPIQAMFDCVTARDVPSPIRFLGARYLVQSPLTLPTVRASVAIDIDGGGAMLRTTQPIAILSRMPKDQRDAMIVIGRSHYDIHHLEFRGNFLAGQVGLHLGATYTNVVRNCLFANLEYGSIGTFCLASAWRDNQYGACMKRAAVLQTGAGSDHGALWPGAIETNSASNVSVFENCRVFGHNDQQSAFAIFGSDAVRLNGCISEGGGSGTDVVFDYQRSPVCKQFHIDMFHCEAPNQTLAFRIRATGKVTIERVVRSYRSALVDASGSADCEIVMRGFAWLGDLPEPSGKGPNPKGRWFFHSRGNGMGAAVEGKSSSSVSFRFEECAEEAWKLLTDPEKWEGGQLPDMLHIRGIRGANGGVMEWSNAPINFLTPLGFADGTTFAGLKTGVVRTGPQRLAPGATATETVDAPGLSATQHFAIVNPAPGQVPPPGLVWNGYLAAENRLAIRLTNVSSAPIAIDPIEWSYCAPRQR